MKEDAKLVTRRLALGWLGGVATASFFGCLARQAGLVDEDDPDADAAATTAEDATATATAEAAAASNATTTSGTCGVTCELTPEQEDGPYYVDLGLVRSDVRDGQAGAELVLTITVLDATTCAPVANAAVEIWSANAAGLYSAETDEGTASDTYLRGVQITNACGDVTFVTIFPGWYAGRASHVNVKVHIGSVANGAYDGGAGHVAHTGQMFFEQADEDAVKAVAPYSANENVYVTNAEDRVFLSEDGSESMLRLTGSAGAGYHAKVALTVDPAATAVTPTTPASAG